MSASHCNTLQHTATNCNTLLAVQHPLRIQTCQVSSTLLIQILKGPLYGHFPYQIELQADFREFLNALEHRLHIPEVSCILCFLFAYYGLTFENLCPNEGRESLLQQLRCSSLFRQQVQSFQNFSKASSIPNYAI